MAPLITPLSDILNGGLDLTNPQRHLRDNSLWAQQVWPLRDPCLQPYCRDLATDRAKQAGAAQAKMRECTGNQKSSLKRGTTKSLMANMRIANSSSLATKKGDSDRIGVATPKRMSRSERMKGAEPRSKRRRSVPPVSHPHHTYPRPAKPGRLTRTD